MVAYGKPMGEWQAGHTCGAFNIVVGNGLAYLKLQDSWRNGFMVKPLRHESFFIARENAWAKRERFTGREGANRYGPFHLRNA